jgi:DNA-binding MarR family transcriptional regulator
MQVPSKSDAAAAFNRAVTFAVPDRRGMAAWTSLLRAHATLLRQLGTELYDETGLTLGEFDVLAQLALAGGKLRMTELAARAFSSRSGMTRRIARLVDEGLICRDSIDTDGRGVVVALTDAGVAKLTKVAPVHLRGVAKRFVGQLTDHELATIERALDKVAIDCSFG